MSMTEVGEAKPLGASLKAKRSKRDKDVWPKKLSKGTKEAPENKKVKSVQFDFAGRVKSINVKADNPNNNQFLVNLISKKGEHRSFILDPSEPLRFSAMADLLTAALGADRKVSIRTAPNANGPDFVSELEVRNKN